MTNATTEYLVKGKPFDAETIKQLSIRAIALVIEREWKHVYFGAVPYLCAMRALDTVDDLYGCDEGGSIVAYFLGNAHTWRGPTAKLIKAELKRRIK